MTISYLTLLNRLHFFFFNDTATTEIYTLSLHDALPISGQRRRRARSPGRPRGELPRGPRAPARRVRRPFPEPGPAEGRRGELGARPHAEAAPPDARPAHPRRGCEDVGAADGGRVRSVREHGDDALRQGRDQLEPARRALHVRDPERRRHGAAPIDGETRMAAENSFDVACKIDPQEVTNALDQARREIETRYDLKGSKNEVRLETNEITVLAADDMKLKAVVDILQSRLHKRGVPLKALTYGKVEEAAGGALRQKISLQQGIPIEKAREIVRLVKDTKLKVQAAIQEDHVRGSGKNRDDLQKVIALLKEKDLGIAIQFTNYRSV